jgi:L-alanine-DL-glutamate epimerase-like enolase superfamily enzyme
MKVTRLDTFTCDLAWRTISYLKVSTDDGLVGWSEFSESFGNGGLGAVIASLSPLVVGQDPMNPERISFNIAALLRPARGGVNRQAIAAIENAMMDVKGKALGVPVAKLLGGFVRDRVPVYWSHCGTYRQPRFARHLDIDPITTFDELAEFGREVVARGFRALKTNAMPLENTPLGNRMIPYARAMDSTGRFADDEMIRASVKTVEALRAGVGDACDIFFDANFLFDHEGILRLERALRPSRIGWLELDTTDASFLSHLRRVAHTPIASGESVYEVGDYRAFFERQAFDIAIVDVPWNGWLESLRIAGLAQAYSVPIASHNFYGHLATAISAQFAAALPNFHMFEVDIDGVPWRDDLVTPPRFQNGELLISDLPGWGVDVNEEAIRAYAATDTKKVHWS